MIFSDILVNNLVHNKTYHIFTHKDLDGAVSLLTFFWSKPNCHISYEEITNLEIDKIISYVNKTINHPEIVLLDLPLRDQFLPDLDKSFITIIDHHERSKTLIEKFKDSKILHKEFTSNCLLIRKIFQEKVEDLPILTEQQKKLILFADDYDCFELKYKESYDLNILFWSLYKNNFQGFIKKYFNGFVPFSEKEKEIIFKVKTEAKHKANTIKKFKSNIKIESRDIDVMAVMSDKLDVVAMDYIIHKYKPDLFMYINTKTERVTFRQKKSETPFDLKIFVEKYCDGSGNKFSAVGKITPLFLELTKNFKEL